MAKRKRAGKKSTSHNNHNHQKPVHHHRAAPQSAEQEQQLDYEDTVNQNDDIGEEVEATAEDDYVWDSKPLKSSKAGFFGNGPKGYIDPSTNQRGAFPELQGLDDDTDLSGPAVDGLSYLRMVRHEARGVPNLLTASQMAGTTPSVKPSTIVIAPPIPAPTSRPIMPENIDSLLYDDDNVAEYNRTHRPVTEPTETVSYDEVPTSEKNPEPTIEKEPGRLSYDEEDGCDYGGDGWSEGWDGEDPYDDLSDSDSSAYYADGAYIARPTPILATVSTAAAVPLRTVSAEWHASLVANFHTTREAILTTPFEEPEIPFPVIPTQWKDFMIANQPSLPVLQTIPSENAIKALKHIRKYLGWRNVHEWQGKWIWALLARANDVGILMNEEVSVLRELGKKAVFNLDKAADARARIMEEGGEDWWNEEMQKGVLEYMNGGGQGAAVDNGEGVKVDDQVGLPVEFKIEDLDFDTGDQEVELDEIESEEDGAKEGRPTKKMALFKPRSIKLSKPAGGSTLLVPSISIIPATPGTEDVGNPMEETVSADQPIPDAADVIDNQLASSQLELELELEVATVSNNTSEVIESKASLEDGELDTEAQDTVQRMPDVKTVFALDMIVSIVGEVFGQRDLLLSRR